MQQQSFIYNFLLSPKFRIWRHISLLLFFIIISVNQALAGYKEIMPILGNKVYLITLLSIITYISIFYIILYIFIPKYLLKGKYLRFALTILIAALIFEIIPNITFLLYMDGYGLLSVTTIIDNISSYSVYLFCISGTIIPVFLKNWIASSQRLDRLEKKRMSSEVAQLKEQINPTSFFKILNKTSILVKSDPQKASTMLMKLGQLLRYQLYDCNREKVLLTAEISFLRNFLELETLYSVRFHYTIITGNINTVFIASSILLPYVQSVVRIIEDEENPQVLNIHISSNENTINIDLKISGIYDLKLLDNELTEVKKRLKTLYRDGYILTTTNNTSLHHTEINLRLDK